MTEFETQIKLIESVYIKQTESLVRIYTDIINLKEAKLDGITFETQMAGYLNKYRINKSDSPPSKETHFPLEEFNHYSSHLEYLTIHSLFLISYSIFEEMMDGIAIACSKQFKQDIDPKKYKNKSYVGISKCYIFDSTHIESTKTDIANWIEIDNYREFRNAISHEGCTLTDKKRSEERIIKLRNILDKYNVIYHGANYHFRIRNSKFLFDFINISVNYISNIVIKLTDLKTN